MIQVEFEFDKKLDWLTPRPKDKKYIALEAIGNIGWTSDRVIEDLEWLEKCREGTFQTDDGQPSFCVGFENSPGIIYVGNNEETAELYDAYDHDKAPYLSLTLDELKDFLTQMRDFLISVGR